jgi:DNA-binding SARP family transcriptional activator
MESGSSAAFSLHTDALLRLVQENDCAALLTAPSFLGPPDPQQCIPFLMAARRQRIHRAYVSGLLEDMGLGEFDAHPGYSLNLQTLGAFRAWRGREEITAKDWQREKARQLLALFIAHRGQFLQREQILEYLWRDVEPAAAEAGFKVALNTLSHTLEPLRPTRSPGFFVLRRESAYGLNPAAAIHVDSEEFQGLVARAGQVADDPQEASRLLSEALALYQGDYLSDFLYEDWALRERERLRDIYVSAATQLAALEAEAGNWSAAVDWCQRALSTDNCWEEAYRILMRCYNAQGNRALVRRTYEQCERALREELNAPPMEETVQLYRQLALDREL